MSSKPEIHKGEGTGRGSAGLGVSIRLSLVYALLFSLGGFVVFTISYFLVAAALDQEVLTVTLTLSLTRTLTLTLSLP